MLTDSGLHPTLGEHGSLANVWAFGPAFVILPFTSKYDPALVTNHTRRDTRCQ